MTIFSKRLQDLLKENSLTKKELCEYLGIGINQIKRWENSDNLPRRYILSAIATKFNVSVDYLLGKEDEINIESGMFAEKIMFLARQKNITIAKMLQDLKMGQGTFSTWKKRGTIPKGETLIKIADYFGVSTDYLLGNEISESDVLNTKEFEFAGNTDVIQLPVIGSVRAGFDSEIIEEDTGEYVFVPTSLLRGHSREDFFALKVKGDSMSPSLLPGDRVLVLRTPSVDSGKIAVILYDSDEATVKKVNYEPGCDYMDLIPINPKYSPVRISGEELNSCRVLGLVVELFRSF